MDPLAASFERIGLSAAKAKETAGNKKLSANLSAVLAAAGVSGDVDRSTGALYYHLASTVSPKALPHLPYIAKAIAAGKLTSNDQVTAGIKHVEKIDPAGEISDVAFDLDCGVGVVVTLEDVSKAVAALLAEKKKDLDEKRYQLTGQLLGALRTSLRWANSLHVKEELDKQILAILGPKDERDDLKAKAKAEKAAKAAKQPAKAAAGAAAAAATTSGPTVSRIAEAAKSSRFIFEGELAKLHKVGENPQINKKLMEEHLKRTGGKVVTRFPPEPNGFLHIGHAKAINVNFGYAAAFGGVTNLRYDDTNPGAEEKIYFDSILETVQWLGFTPTDITYSSDHFQKLYELAIELIKKDKAYVCHCTGEQIKADRGGEERGSRRECIHRNRPIAESLAEFEKMKNGEYEPKEAFVRMKMDMNNPNPQFWDLVAYRILKAPHHRTGDQWCIYPTYDFTHCLVDSFEDITHSLCTTEFTLSRESYYWLVDALEIYKPVQWEYGRLRLAHSVMSKRKLKQLVDEKHVNGWDDPRMYTMAGIRRRGFTPESVNAFVRDLGVTTANSTTLPSRLENVVREHLNEIAPRLMLVLDPLKITITNLSADHLELLTVQNKPRDDSMGTRDLPFTNTVYIERSDFRETADANFFRLVPGGTVGLLNVPYPITATEVVKDAAGQVIEVKARYENSPGFKRPKTYIHWVARSPAHHSPVELEVRLYSELFLHADPTNEREVPGGFLSDINPNSLVVVPRAMADVGLRLRRVEDKFQALRTGYFCVDKDSDISGGKYVVNRTVTLKEDSGKD
ncbi:hypothetical protein HDU87_007903 [Geranomyces variabilis]|uniref:glutamine--tRNA ligase n=1 Tax=Geranomyces variabilis TaxID=109894 RepID=A0AAD5XPJ9_9FUNG|nr:hypothetical protein HDU87_007903 [Geranomyces variabilis]